MYGLGEVLDGLLLAHKRTRAARTEESSRNRIGLPVPRDEL